MEVVIALVLIAGFACVLATEPRTPKAHIIVMQLEQSKQHEQSGCLPFVMISMLVLAALSLLTFS